MDDKGEKPLARRGGGKRWLKGALIVALGAALVWLAAPTVLGGPEPPPLWTEADLPAAPARAENGWHELDALPRAASDLPSEIRGLLRVDKQGGSWLERARAVHAPLAATLDSGPARETLATFERAIGKPRFADVCPVKIEEPCPIFPLLGAHRLALLASLRKAESGDWSSAVTLLAKTIRADLDFASTSRSMVAHMVALTDLREASELASDLFETYRGERAREPSTAKLGEDAVAALAALDAELARLDPSALGAQRGLIVEYLHARRAPDLATKSDAWQMRSVTDEKAPGTIAATKSWPADVLAPLLLDRGATQVKINARFAALRDSIAASAPLPTFPREREEPFWWLYNVTGEVLLDVINMDWSGPLRGVSEGRARIEALRPGLRKLSQDLSRT